MEESKEEEEEEAKDDTVDTTAGKEDQGDKTEDKSNVE